MIKEEFIKRREKFIKAMDDNSMAIIFSGEMARKSADETFDFTPNRNFYYLSGIDETNDILVMLKSNKKVQNFLFISRPSEYHAKWFGATYTNEEAVAKSGLKPSEIYYLDEFNDMFNWFANRVDHLYLDLEREGYTEAKTTANDFANIVQDKYPGVKITNCYPMFVTLRMAKSNEEIKEMKKAISITKKGIEELMKHSKECIGQKEYYLEAYFDKLIKQEGASDFAFDTIAASGVNGCVLHYRANNSTLKDGDLVLFDLGAEYNYYKSDITRTFPINGKFTPRQKQIYEIVLGGQQVVCKYAKEGVTTGQLNQYLINYFAKELKKIGLIKKDEEVSKYYFHSCSHHIGLDTHDVQRNEQPLPAGAIISNEPGLYIKEEGIGIRIEDDILITKTGCEVLSKDIIKSVKDIEAFMKKYNGKSK